VRLYPRRGVLHAMLIADGACPSRSRRCVVIALIVAYTFEGGVKTIVWTDLLQTACMLSGLVVVIGILLSRLQLDSPAKHRGARRRGLSRMFVLDPMAEDSS
jgi:hypothetical protein